MEPKHVFLAQALSYAGALPILAGVIAAYLRIEGIDAINLTRIYAAVIVSFMGGIHWACFLFFSNKCPRNLLTTSTSIALFAWASLMFTEVKLALVLQSLCFLYLLVLDYRLKEAKLLPLWFYALRLNVTGIVLICLMMLELAPIS